MRRLMIVVGVLLVAASAEAKRYVMAGDDLRPGGAVNRVRWKQGTCGPNQRACWTLKARYRCRALDADFQAIQCPSRRWGKLVAESQSEGDFYGTMGYPRDGVTCVVNGLLTSQDDYAWRWDLEHPKTAAKLRMGVQCDNERGASFSGESPQ